MSSADCVIVILKNIFSYLNEFKDHHYNDQIKLILEVLNKLFDNIKNGGKNINSSVLIGSLKVYVDLGLVGCYRVNHISILEEEEKRQKTEFSGSGIRLTDDGENKISEVSWTDE